MKIAFVEPVAGPGSRVSSTFFMCLPDEVASMGDCAINPKPSAEDLADIAIASAASARAFGIEPRVAMISFSTGTSAVGTDVEKVDEATRIAREREPGLAVDGPLQYDAAAVASVGQAERPGSPVAGHATVFIFPDLDTGNTTYKAVQRSAQVFSIGPMLQGLAKPVNDLSRGALVDDIIYNGGADRDPGPGHAVRSPAGQAALGGSPVAGSSPSAGFPSAALPSAAGRTSDTRTGRGPGSDGTSGARASSGPAWLSPNALLRVFSAVVTSLGITHTVLP